MLLFQGLLDHKESQAPRDVMELQDLPVLQDHLDHQDLKDKTDVMEAQALQDLKEQLV